MNVSRLSLPTAYERESVCARFFVMNVVAGKCYACKDSRCSKLVKQRNIARRRVRHSMMKDHDVLWSTRRNGVGMCHMEGLGGVQAGRTVQEVNSLADRIRLEVWHVLSLHPLLPMSPLLSISPPPVPPKQTEFAARV